MYVHDIKNTKAIESYETNDIENLCLLGDVPAGVDDDLWWSKDFFHIYFNLPSLTNGAAAESHLFSPSSPEEESNESLHTFHTVTQTPAYAQHQPSRFSSVKLGSAVSIAARKGSNVVSAKLMLYKLGRRLQEVRRVDGDIIITIERLRYMVTSSIRSPVRRHPLGLKT